MNMLYYGDNLDILRRHVKDESVNLLLGDNDMLAYLSMMAPRLVELNRVLKLGGVLYLHCDTTAGAHLRLLCDAIFGTRCFQNEIVWRYRRWPTPAMYFQRMHDVILVCSKGAKVRTFNVEYEPNSPSYAAWTSGIVCRPEACLG